MLPLTASSSQRWRADWRLRPSLAAGAECFKAADSAGVIAAKLSTSSSLLRPTPTAVAGSAGVVAAELTTSSSLLHQTLTAAVISAALRSLAGLGGLSSIASETIARHASLRAAALKHQQGKAMPPQLSRPLLLMDAESAVLRRACTSTMLRMQFGTTDGAQDGALRPASDVAATVDADAQAMASTALDERAIETLCAQGCVVRPDFLSAEDAAALLEEFVALSDEHGMGASGGVASSASSAASLPLESAQGTAAMPAPSTSCTYRGRSIFDNSETATCNQAEGRQFFNLSSADARRLGAPVLARTLDALSALAHGLSAAATLEGRRRGSPATWWDADVRAPTRGMIQRYPPGAHYQEHTDTHFLGDGWASPRTFTALVYAHKGWREGDGGELTVRPPGYAPRMCEVDPRAGGAPTVVQPRGGTLALFPAHLIHEVAPVRGVQRYAVTTWISLGSRTVDALDDGGATKRAAAQLSSLQWCEVMEAQGPRGTVPPGTIMANQVLTARMTARAMANPWQTGPEPSTRQTSVFSVSE